jgi:hypothetical protein
MKAVLLLYDAWVFFTLLLLFVSILVIVAPVRLADALLGTDLVAPLVRLIEIVGNL